MVDKMEFANGKYTVIHDNGKLTVLRNGEPWNRDLVGDNLIYWWSIDDMELKQQLGNDLNTNTHPDDMAIDRFSVVMKEKMQASREKGRSGWDDPDQCDVRSLASMLIEHLHKGNPGTFEDIANFAMMLHQRGADPKILSDMVVSRNQPVAWEYRSFHAQDTSTPGWGPWERLEPSGRYVGETAETMAADIQHYIDQGYKYELRALYSGPVMTKSTQDKSFESEDQMFNTNCWGMY